MSTILPHQFNDAITIRRAESVADYRACQEAQRRAWGITEDGYLIPIATMVGANLHGGLVLGAFLKSGEAVGMSFGFLGRVEGRLALYSQLTGVIPGRQSGGLGYQLKVVQRDFARSEGLPLIAWAFDPLQAGNARFNLDKLGARARRYLDNMYGERTDALNAGVPTDRLIAEWDTNPVEKVEVPPETIASLPRLIRTGAGPSGQHLPLSVEARFDAELLLLEVPSNIAHLRREHPDVAEWWRSAVRGAFRSAFSAGYQAVGFIRDEGADPRRCYYLLKKEESGLRKLSV